MSTVRLHSRQWKKIRADLKTQYPITVFMIRHKMREVLGFTVREHNEWVDGDNQFTICLDFYSERKYTMFLLKYSEYISKDNQ